MRSFKSAFQPDYERYDGLRPIIVHALRLGFVLVFVIVGQIAWTRIVNHRGDWDPIYAAALCMWATQSMLSLIGIFHPLKMLPLVLFEILYKLLWLIIVALPLWSANRLAGSPAEDLTYACLGVVIPMVLVPWPYVLRKYIWSRHDPQSMLM
ncbi:MAG TPA: hypothetical protein VK210_10280 [Terriglobia bacterium]|nr:hypothetical protein [Terriglobia bacterium]